MRQIGVLAAVALAYALAPGYTCQELPGMPDTDTPGKMFVTEGGAVAGYWYRYVPPGHAGAVLAKPFIWVGNAMVALPLGPAEHGHVYAGNDSIVVGDAGGEAVMWTPDPKAGWQGARKQTLCKDGDAKWIDKDGGIYIQSENLVRIWRDGQMKNVPMEQRDLVGVDERGRWFSNSYAGYQAGGLGHVPNRGLVWEAKAWKSLHPDGYTSSAISAINRGGIAVGSVLKDSWRAAIWDGAGFRELVSPKGYSSAEAVNDSGAIVGMAAGHPYLWDHERPYDLSPSVLPGKADMAVSVNSKGMIVVEDNRSGGHAYLLTPKP